MVQGKMSLRYTLLVLAILSCFAARLPAQVEMESSVDSRIRMLEAEVASLRQAISTPAIPTGPMSYEICDSGACEGLAPASRFPSVQVTGFFQ